jgi:hypothetical protein
MKQFYFLFILFIFAPTFLACEAQTVSQSAITPELQNTNNSNSSKEEPEQIDGIFVDKDSLSYNGYDVVKLKKKVKLEYPPEMKSKPELVEVSYAVLKKKNKVLDTFDGVYFGAGNATNFGLFPFLGKETKQLTVSQTIPRGGRHWVVELSSEARVISDSKDYGIGREEFSVIDIDKDGVYEISLPITEFYMFENMAMSETPLPTIIFKYDEKAKKYLPANRIFRNYLLTGIEDKIKQLNSSDKSNYLSDRLDIVLRYVYAGKEAEAWSFFDKEYNLPNKEEIKSKIKSTLKKENVYKYIYENRAS